MRRQSTEDRAQNTDLNKNSSRITHHDLSLGSEKGLTLIEVLIALTILAIGLLGVGLMQVTSISGNIFSKEMAVATELGQDMLEKLKAMQYGDPALTGSALPGTNHPTTADVTNGLAPAVFGNSNNIIDERGLTVGPLLYTRVWAVVNNTPATDMKYIYVAIGWTDRTGTEHIIGMSGVKVEE